MYINQPLTTTIANKLMPKILKITPDYEAGKVTAAMAYYEYDEWQKYLNATTEEDTNVESFFDSWLTNTIVATPSNIKDYDTYEPAIYETLISILRADGFQIEDKNIITNQ